MLLPPSSRQGSAVAKVRSAFGQNTHSRLQRPLGQHPADRCNGGGRWLRKYPSDCYLSLRPRERWRSIVMSTSVCLCVSVCPRAHLPNHTRDLRQFLCMLPIAVAWSSSDGVTQYQKEGAILGVFFPTDNALYIIAFGTHTETAEPIARQKLFENGLSNHG